MEEAGLPCICVSDYDNLYYVLVRVFIHFLSRLIRKNFNFELKNFQIIIIFMGNSQNNSMDVRNYFINQLSDALEDPFFNPPLQVDRNVEVEHLTTSPENRILIEQILHSNQDMLAYYTNLSVYYQGFGGNNPLRSKIKLKKSCVQKPELFLDRNNLSIVLS